MAQYYQVVSQSDKSQEDTHQYYAGEQQTVQYVLTHEDPQQTFQGQQIMVNNQLMVVDNSIPPVIVDVDPSQIQYQPEYVVQEAPHVIYNEDVDTGQTQPVVLNHMQPNPQKILLSLHHTPRQPNSQEMTQHNVSQPATILNTGHMSAQLRQQMPPEHQMVQQVYRNQQQVGVGQQQRPNLGQPSLLNTGQQQQQLVGVGRGVGARHMLELRLPVTLTGGAPPLRTVLQQPHQQLQVGIRVPGGVAMGRGVVRGAVGMLQQQTTPQQQQMVRTQLSQQQHQQQPVQQAANILNSTPTTTLQSNGDNKVVQLEDGTIMPIAAYKQMMYNQSQAKASISTSIPKPPPKRRPAKPRAPKKTAAQLNAAKNEGIATNSPIQSHPTQPNPMYSSPVQNNQPPIPNQSPLSAGGPSPGRTPSNSLASGMIQNANQEDADGVSVLANFVPSAQIQTIIANTLKNDNYSDSIRMLVLLENGEQRLITFTMPREQCTIQEILEQVNVPFKADTKIEMVEMNCNGLNYVVGVGDVKVNMGNQQCQPLQPHRPNEPPLPGHSPSFPIPPPPPPPSLPLPVPPPSTQHRVAAALLQPAVTASPPPPIEQPKLVPGRLAICNHCGYLSEDFNRCSRCKTKFPELVKSMAASDVFKNGGKPLPGLQQPAGDGGVGGKPVAPAVNANPSASASNKSLTKKKVSTRSKVPEPEPVVLLSSDEDDEDEKMKLLYEQVRTNVSCTSMKKEPTALETTEKADSLPAALPEATFDEVLKDHEAVLECRTIRVGSFRYSPSDNFLIYPQHITFKAPTIDDPDVWRTITIDKRTIVKVLVNFNRLLPVIFYYITPNAARVIREALNMVDEETDPYFDPLGKEEAFKRITILPVNFTETMRTSIKLIYCRPSVIVEELSSKEANDILVRTCPRDIKKTVESNATYTEIRQLLIYPPGKGGISINTEDYMCLAQDQFLNDVIIDFYLQHLVLNLPPKQQEKIHVFSTFFYIRLTTKPVKASRRSQPTELDSSLTPAQKRHARVKNWTKKVDLFDKDFVIVPINESCHWFLAIICYPGMIGCHTMDNKPIQGDKIMNIVKKNPLLNTATLAGAVTITQIKKEKFDPKKIVCEDGSTSDKDEAEGDDSEFESMDGEAETEEPVQQPKERVPIKQPCILIFDSLAGASRIRVVATLRDYLTCEYKAKRKDDRPFNKDTIKGACPKVPQQTNYTDCGLYLLQYVESFLSTPIRDYHIPINCLKNWFEEMVVTKKREDVSNLIRDLMVKHGRDPEMLPEIMLPTVNGELLSHYEDEPEEPEDDEEDEEEDEETGELTPKAKPTVNGPSKDPLSTSNMETEDCNSTTNDDGNQDTETAQPMRIVRKLWPPPPPLNKTNSPQSPLISNSGHTSADDECANNTADTTSSAVASTPPSMSSTLSNSPGGDSSSTVSSPVHSDSLSTAAGSSDAAREKPTTDRETMSYLKSKRIVRHKGAVTNDAKKFKHMDTPMES